MSEPQAPSEIVEFKSQAQFEELALSTDLPIIIDFWAPWCGPCRRMAPVFEALAAEKSGQAIFAKINTESYPQVAKPFKIRSIPTFIVFHKEEIFDIRVGGGTEPQIRAFVQRALDHHQGVGVLGKVKRFFGGGEG